MRKIKVSLAQMEVVKGDCEENLRKAGDFIARAKGLGSEMICFPEMWTSGLDRDACARIAAMEDMVGRITGLAKRYSIWLNGSMPAPDESGKVANASLLIGPDGGIAAVYRKIHLFPGLGEDGHIAAGRAPCLADTPWGKVGLSVCYDIRFPELFRAYAMKGARIVISASAFPASRGAHWNVLVRARAIENQIFVAAANRVGSEDLGKNGIVKFFGTSAIIDPSGETLIEGRADKEELLTAELDLRRIDEVRAAVDYLRDRRPDAYEIP